MLILKPYPQQNYHKYQGFINKIQGYLIVIIIIIVIVLFNKLTKNNQYEKLSDKPTIMKRSSSVKSYHFQNHKSGHHTVLQKLN
jgi:hypothetical protein